VDESADGLVLLIGSGRQPYREYLIDGASRRRPLWLIDDHAPTWQRPYLAGSGVVEPLDSSRLIPDQRGLLDAAAAVARNHRVRGIFTYDEPQVIATAHVADRLGLPGLTTEAAQRCRDKHRTRLALTAAGLPQPRFALAGTAGGAAEAAAAIGYPVVLKPRGMAASIGVVRVDGPDGLAAAFGVAERASHSGPVALEGGVLVEELVDGPEISIDGAIVAGRYLPFCIAHKQLGLPPYFEEVGHLVDGADPLLGDAELRRVLGTTHRALGVRYGITHTEVRLSARGLVVIEVNARLGGDLIPYLGKLATAVDPGGAAVDVAVGALPALEPDRGVCAGVRFLYPPEDCRVVEIAVPEPAAVPGLLAAHAMVAPGDAVRLPPRTHIGRYAYVICTADDPATCAARLEDAATLVELKYEALEESELVSERPW
jgi:biotin carboxylase